jgi:NADH-quinone oxidoreductase subunit N
MSTPIVWIAFPALLSFIAFFLRRWNRVIAVLLAIVVLVLAVGAWIVPINEVIFFGPWSLTLSDRFVFAGRQFILDQTDRTILGMVYLSLSFFFVGALPAGVSKLFIPLGLAMGAVLIASLAVEPFLYAALFIQVGVLLGVPLLSPPGISVDRSVLRYLTFLSFGMPFILFSGWMLPGIDIEISDPVAMLPALVFLGFGFAFLLAVFPLNTWIPMLTGQTHPYAATFVITILSLIVITLLQRFIGDFSWLLEYDVIQYLGLLVLLTAGLWAAFQRDLGRLLGFAVIIEIGRSLLIISQPEGELIYEAMLLPRLLALGVWALSVAFIRAQTNDLSFRAVQGFGRSSPLAAFGIIAGIFSIAGFPLLAGFPVQIMMWQQIVQDSPSVTVWGVLGGIGLLIGGLRSLAVLVMGPIELPSGPNLKRPAQVLLILELVFLFIMGIFPHWFIGIFSG